MHKTKKGDLTTVTERRRGHTTLTFGTLPLLIKKRKSFVQRRGKSIFRKREGEGPLKSSTLQGREELQVGGKREITEKDTGGNSIARITQNRNNYRQRISFYQQPRRPGGEGGGKPLRGEVLLLPPRGLLQRGTGGSRT